MVSGERRQSEQEPSRSNAFKVGTPVWMRFENFWWPGVVVHRKDIESTIEVPSGDALPQETDNNRMVEHFNDNRKVSVVSVRDLVEYTSSVRLARQSRMSAQLREQLLLACQEANSYIRGQLNAMVVFRPKRRSKRLRADEDVENLHATAEKMHIANERVQELISKAQDSFDVEISALANAVDNLQEIESKHDVDDERRKAFDEEGQNARTELKELLLNLSADRKAFEEHQSNSKQELEVERKRLKNERSDFVNYTVQRKNKLNKDRDQFLKDRKKLDDEKLQLVKDKKRLEEKRKRYEKDVKVLEREQRSLDEVRERFETNRQGLIAELNRSRKEHDKKQEEFISQLKSSQGQVQKIQEAVLNALNSSRQQMDNERARFQREGAALRKSQDEIQAAVRNEQVRLSELQNECSELEEKRDSLRNEIEQMESRRETVVVKESEELPDEVMASVVHADIQELERQLEE